MNASDAAGPVPAAATVEPVGLSSAEAARRLARDGANEWVVTPGSSVLRSLAALLREPLFMLLFAAAGLYLMLGDRIEALALVASVAVAAAITLFQNVRTERVLIALRNLSSPRAAVMRDGALLRIAGREVVEGDCLLVREGDRIAADALIVDADGLKVDESLLTGESVAVDRFANAALQAGTLVVAGQARAVVSATGPRTQFGKIGATLMKLTDASTPLQRDTARLARGFGLAGGMLSVALVLIYGALHGDWVNALLRGLTLAMAILPEEFPLVITVFLALGAWRLARHQVLTRRPGAIEALGAATVLCVDKTGTLTQNRMRVAQAAAAEDSDAARFALQHAVAVACETDSFEPMDQACLQWVAAQGAPSPAPAALRRRYPLRPDRLFVGIARSAGASHWQLAVKGAPEHVLALCALSPDQLDAAFAQVQRWAEDGQRVLAVASAQGDAAPPDDLAQAGLVYRGLIGFADPLRDEVPQAVAECRRAGIRLLVITGDYASTAGAIARQAGIAEVPRVVLGSELDAWSDDELIARLRGIDAVARATPLTKLRIVQTLQRSGAVVAMTGDGVNDAPALRAAHIGVAMGQRGSDVAREAASLVLLQDDFGSLVQAVRQGRRVFANLRQALLYVLAVHVPVVALSLLPMLLGAPQLLMPIHVMFLEFVIDPACSLAFEAERDSDATMASPPRRPDEHVLGRPHFAEAARQGLVALAASLVTLAFATRTGADPGQMRAAVFATIVAMNLALILHDKRAGGRWLARLTAPNPVLWAVVGITLLALALVLSVPALRGVFHFELPPKPLIAVAAASVLGASILLEWLPLPALSRQTRSAAK